MAKTHVGKARAPATKRPAPPPVESLPAVQPVIVLAYVAGPGGSIRAERHVEHPVTMVPQDRIFTYDGIHFEFVGPDDQGRRVYRTVMRG